jgi:transposase
VAHNARTRPMSWPPSARSTDSSASLQTLRATLNALAIVAPDWLRLQVDADWFDRSGRRIEEERLPKGQQARRLYAAQVGADGQRVLDAVAAPDTPELARQAPEVAVLRRLWEHQFTRAQDGGFALCDGKSAAQGA